ncbi:Protochlorophyllide reductase C-like protein [Lachnellula occidentalis]|uniref:3beta-hydroxysteroid 3-dehydrogenase n=1 Tax=Lachnellula occidentalis TaxID=215460 RepID=A0A8H8UHF0_9HELO|nr:Protochlorophyllide reductase C-like protein [Lachnellula occidentalis]
MTALKGTVLLTGANGGLGSAIVQSITTRPELATYHGVYAVRSLATATLLKSTLQASKSHPHDILPLDLSELSSVRETAATINAKVSTGEIPRISALILNAGYREPQGQTWTESGLDIAFASNYLGQWLLALLLLQSMDWELGRVVIVGGWVHDPLDKANKASGAFEEDQWKEIFADASSETVESVAKGTWSTSHEDPSKDPRGLSGVRRYGAAKLCIIMMIQEEVFANTGSVELQRRLNSDPKLSGISVLGVDPGMMPTKITTNTLNWLIRFLIFIVAQVSSWLSPNGMLRLPHKSAGDVLAAALDNGPLHGERPKGLYFNGSEPKEVSVEAKDARKRSIVWKASVEYAGLKEEETYLANWA